MGKNSPHSWFDAVKKAFRSPSNDNGRSRDENAPEEDEKKRGKKRWLFRRHSSVETIQHNVVKCANSSAVRICGGEENLVRKQPKMENPASEQRRAFEVAMATTAAAEAAVATAQAAVEIIRLTRPSLSVKQDQAAVIIQKIFRGYLARRALMALRGVVKLQALIRGHNVRKRAKMTLQCIQSLVRVQALVCDQRRRLSCEAATLDSIFDHDNISIASAAQPRLQPRRNSSSLNVDPCELHLLIQKARECSLKQGKTLADALSQQISEEGRRAWYRKDEKLCHGHHEQNLESMFIPTPVHGKQGLQSPRTPSSSSMTRSSHRSDNSCPLPRPNYMAATASAIARVRPSSTPRQRLSTQSRDRTAKKRLSFPALNDETPSDKPYYATD